ncbi:MAG: hypothetical protein QOC80_532, partial [Frankiaceae bacterium]|nr:hypothetical protein [Frankiaceae bacterium]
RLSEARQLRTWWKQSTGTVDRAMITAGSVVAAAVVAVAPGA